MLLEALGPRPLGGLFARLLGRARVAIVGQALCVALAAYTLALAAALHTGAELGTLGAHGAALVAALAVGWAWYAEHPLDIEDVLRRADSKLRLQGALVAAYEEEGRDPDGAFAAVVTRRVLGSAPPSHLREAAHAHTVPFAAAPLVGVVVLALVSATAAARRALEDVGGGQLAFLAAEQMTVALRSASRAGALTPEQVGALSQLESEARALGVAADADEGARPKSDTTPAAQDEAERAAELARAADALAAQLAHAPDAAREALARAAQALDTHALRSELRSPLAGAPQAGSGRDAGAEQPGGAAPGPDAGDGAPRRDDGAELPEDGPKDGPEAATYAGIPEVTNPAGGTAADPSSARNGTGGETGVTDTSPDVTMQGSTGATRAGEAGTGAPPAPADPVEVARPDRPSGPSEAQPAVAVGRPWSRRYDALVASWAARRASAPPTDPPETPPQ